MIENALLTCKNDFIFKELDKADLAKIVLAFEPYTVNAGAQIITQVLMVTIATSSILVAPMWLLMEKMWGSHTLIMTTNGECSGTKH